MAKFDNIRESNMINPFINRLWVEVKLVWVIFRLTQLTCLINGLWSGSNMQTSLTYLTHLAYKCMGKIS